MKPPNLAGVVTAAMQGVVRGYQLLISPLLAPSCRYLPSCSDYAIGALAQHGALRGGVLALRRLCRCHPWGGTGYDPVPQCLSPEAARGAEPRRACAAH
jgi:uncharacterized protein